MKKINIISVLKYISVLTLLTTLSISCDELVNEEPVSEIPITDFYGNLKDAEVGVMGIYDAMQTAYNENYFRWGEIRSDSYTRGSGSASTNDLDLVDNNVNSGNAAVTRWNIMYTMINRANLAILKIPQITAYDKSLLGEALALRAYAYFTMVRVWGGVPLYTKPTIEIQSGTDLFKPRTDASTILNSLIIPDMIQAGNLISAQSSDFRWSKASIYAFQAEVYMWLKDYPNAKIALDKLVALKTHSLATTAQAWQDQFYNNPPDVARLPFTVTGTRELGRGKVQKGSELIFSLFFDQSNPTSNIGVSNGNRSGIQRNFMAGLPPFYISKSLEAKWRERFPTDSTAFVTKYPGAGNVLTRPDSKTVNGKIINFTRKIYGDYRFYLSREGVFDFASIPAGQGRVIKWQQFNIPVGVDDSNIPIYRYSGQLLLLAEVENRLNNVTGALALINQIRTARLLPLVTLAEFGATVDAREDYILDERQFELLGEGQRAFDLIRTGKFVETMNKEYASRGTKLIDANRILLPIYFEHFQENPAIKGQQNPGYDTN